ncbi:hypothetical protein CEXT_159661 [Caerostris extrusa]|uniref:Uncharacterized protein n=1 Tax=Caerostris extrusa TaxID=172846 RepID=A0AAV4Y8B9_CAEEX|nr:hypothetical protein CEXT_159661 [Caerostris extrusa]
MNSNGQEALIFKRPPTITSNGQEALILKRPPTITKPAHIANSILEEAVSGAKTSLSKLGLLDGRLNEHDLELRFIRNLV